MPADQSPHAGADSIGATLGRPAAPAMPDIARRSYETVHTPLADDISVLSAQLHEQHSGLDGLRATLTALNTLGAHTQHQINRLHARVSDMEHMLHARGREATALRAERDGLQDMVTERDAALARAETDLSLARLERDNTKAALEGARAAQVQQDQQIAELRQSLATQQNEAAQALSARDRAVFRIAELDLDVANLVAERDKAQAAAVSSTTTLKALREERDAEKQRADDLARKLARPKRPGTPRRRKAA